MDSAPLPTPADIIGRFGGSKALATKLGIPRSTVGNWLSLGIPTKWHGRLVELAERDGISLAWKELLETTNLRRAS